MGEQLEEPTYDLIARHDGFEVRRYHGSIEARTRTDGVDLRERGAMASDAWRPTSSAATHDGNASP